MKLSGISLDTMDSVIEKIARLNLVQRITICALTLLLLFASFGYFYFYPQYQRLDSMTKELKQVEQQLASARTAASQIEKFRQEMKDAEDDFNVSRNALPDKEEIPLLLTSISQFGHDAGLEFVLFEPKPEVPKDFYAEIPVAITVSGNYHNVGVFFDKVSNLNRIVNIKDIKMTPPAVKGAAKGAAPAGDPARLVTSCVAVTYKFQETPAAPEGKSAAKGGKKPAAKK